MPWLWPLTAIQPALASRYATAMEAVNASPAVPMTSNGRIGLR